MPSWVHSRIYIRGDEVARNQIVEANFDFETLNPCPEEEDSTVWTKENYETWQEGPANIKDQDYRSQICVSTSTAWVPPTKFCTWLLTNYKNLWIKIMWESEDSQGGVILLARGVNGEIKETKFEWSEPFYDDENCLRMHEE
jgi:hypothetical protein